MNRGSLNSAHIHGTDVPVEEPSTASLTEVGFSFDQFVGDLLEEQRHLKVQQLGGLEIDDQIKLRRGLDR